MYLYYFGAKYFTEMMHWWFEYSAITCMDAISPAMLAQLGGKQCTFSTHDSTLPY